MKIPFNKPYWVGTEIDYIRDAIQEQSHISGNGTYTKRCQEWISNSTGCSATLLTHSCTAALEMAALLLGLGDGDEVIMPSFTFVSTANAFALRGAVPVFVDIEPATLNIDPARVEQAISPATRAICVVHYAGVSCDMDAIMDIARRHDLPVIEDAAQAVLASYKGRQLGSIGQLGAFSFHETKNIISGEGGALLINDIAFHTPAEILWEKGTDRSRFLRGQVDKYTWRSLGSSYTPSELVAAFLYGQLEKAEELTVKRKKLWDSYHEQLQTLEQQGWVRRQYIPEYAEHNAHMYYILLGNAHYRNELLAELNTRGVNAVFHYVPLHTAPAATRYAKTSGPMEVTESLSARLIRLPLWTGMDETHTGYVASVLEEILSRQYKYQPDLIKDPWISTQSQTV